jgi:hypothetical protein
MLLQFNSILTIVKHKLQFTFRSIGAAAVAVLWLANTLYTVGLNSQQIFKIPCANIIIFLVMSQSRVISVISLCVHERNVNVS